MLGAGTGYKVALVVSVALVLRVSTTLGSTTLVSETGCKSARTLARNSLVLTVLSAKANFILARSEAVGMAGAGVLGAGV